MSLQKKLKKEEFQKVHQSQLLKCMKLNTKKIFNKINYNTNYTQQLLAKMFF